MTKTSFMKNLEIESKFAGIQKNKALNSQNHIELTNGKRPSIIDLKLKKYPQSMRISTKIKTLPPLINFDRKISTNLQLNTNELKVNF